MPEFKYPIVDPGLDTVPSKHLSINPLDQTGHGYGSRLRLCATKPE